MNPPTMRVVYLTDSPEGGGPGTTLATPAAGGDVRALPVQTHVPLSLLAAVGERVAEVGLRMQRAPQEDGPGGVAGTPAGAVTAAVLAEAERLERFGLQLQELAQVAARAQQLRHEAVDLGLALVQTVAEWSAEANRLGVELHGPVCSEPVHANPAALKHLLDLMVEHALQQGRAVRLGVEAPTSGSGVAVVATVSSEPASQSPVRDTLAWMALQWFARALGLTPLREVVPRGERLTLVLPRG